MAACVAGSMSWTVLARERLDFRVKTLSKEERAVREGAVGMVLMVAEGESPWERGGLRREEGVPGRLVCEVLDCPSDGRVVVREELP